MELRPDHAKITHLLARFDPAPAQTQTGQVLWATVEIEYSLAGLSPTMAIRLPLLFQPAQTEAERRSQAFRSARLLIDHACRAVGSESNDEPGALNV